MSDTFQCGDNAALVGYLYDECEPAERTAIGAHVAVCGACAAELAALESTRVQLGSWTPPEAELGFAVVRPARSEASEAGSPRLRGGVQDSPGARGLRPGAWWHQPPAWVQVAAAVVIFAAGLSLGIARGTIPVAPRADATAAAAPGSAVGTEGVSSADLTALEQRLREEITQIRAAASAQDAAAPSSLPEAQLLARVRALIDESEQRQRRELALRTAQIMRDFDSQRRVDLDQIQRSFGQIEGLTGAEVREQRQMLNYLMRVSQQQ